MSKKVNSWKIKSAMGYIFFHSKWKQLYPYKEEKCLVLQTLALLIGY